MIFDTDIFIWIQRGNEKAARQIEKYADKFLSIQSYMELLQSAKNKTHHKYVKDFIASYGFVVLPFTENIGHRASIYIEEYTLSSGLRSEDAIIAAAAVKYNMPLFSSNEKHFKMIKELKLKVFKP